MESGRGVGDGATACREGRCMDIKERINENSCLVCWFSADGAGVSLWGDCRHG